MLRACSPQSHGRDRYPSCSSSGRWRVAGEESRGMSCRNAAGSIDGDCLTTLQGGGGRSLHLRAAFAPKSISVCLIQSTTQRLNRTVLLQNNITRMNSDSITFSCPTCGQNISASRADAGANADCPACNQPLKVPDPSDAHQPPISRVFTWRRKPLLLPLVTVSALLFISVTAIVLHIVSVARVGRESADRSQTDPEYARFSQQIKNGKILTGMNAVEWEGNFVRLVEDKERYKYEGEVTLAPNVTASVGDTRSSGVILDFPPLESGGGKGEVWLQFDKDDLGESWKAVKKGQKVRISAICEFLLKVEKLTYNDGTPVPNAPDFVVFISKVKLVEPGKR